MKIKKVLVPELSESVSEAALLGWQKNPGDFVREGDVLVSVETDKIVMEVYAPCDGALKSVHKREGDQVAAGELLAEIDASAKAPAEAPKPAEQASAKAASPPPAPASEAAPASVAPAAGGAAPAAAPSAKKIAAERGVDLRTVQGSGRGGRITKGDVLSAGGAGGASSRAERREPMSKLRARIAERMLQSQRETASLTTFNEANMQAISDLRASLREDFEKAHGVRLGIMSFFVKAAASALLRHPVVNAAVDGGDIVYRDYCDIGVAVGTPRGLVVPILRNAESMSMAEIERQIADFGARAQSGALSLDEITGGTFSITNGGVFGSMLSTPILNPPQSAILGVHATRPRPVAENGEVVIRPMNYLALTYDHRIIDGRDAVLFLSSVKDALENPARMLLDV